MIIIRLILTALIVVAAVFGAIYVWDSVFEDPWTRDAHVRADIVEIAPQVSGPITEIEARNNALVQAGDRLLTIDPTDYQLALEKAKAALGEAEAQSALKAQQAARYDALQQRDAAAVANVDVANARLEAQAAAAAVASAKAALDRAQKDLERTVLLAPTTGRIANLTADTGDYANAGTALLAIVDEASFRVDAFFVETKLPAIRVGDPARVKLMASGETLTGEVAGISAGIAYGQDTSSALLQSPEPSFQWIRLAQRVPVEIALKERPKVVPLVNGATASVIVEVPDDRRDGPIWDRIWSALR